MARDGADGEVCGGKRLPAEWDERKRTATNRAAISRTAGRERILLCVRSCPGMLCGQRRSARARRRARGRAGDVTTAEEAKVLR